MDKYPSDKFYNTSKYGLPPYEVRHSYKTLDSKTILHPTTLYMYYKNIDPTKAHGNVACSAEFSCPDYHACDVDTKMCVSTDIIPDWTVVNGKIIAGSGKAIIEYMLDQGIPLGDIIDSNKYILTRYMKDYIEIIKKNIRLYDNVGIIDNRKDSSEGITIKDIPGSFSNIVQVGKYMINRTGWPSGLRMIADFLSYKSQESLFNLLEGKKWVPASHNIHIQYYGYKYNTQTKTFTPGDIFPDILKCISDFLYAHKIIKKIPNQITVTKYEAGAGYDAVNVPKSFGDELAILSTGSFTLLTFEKKGKIVEVPAIPGSLIILKGSSIESWTNSMPMREQDVYKIPHQENQTWKRGDRITIAFKTITV